MQPASLETKIKARRFYDRHKNILQQVLAGLDPNAVSFPSTAAKWWLTHLYDPFAEVYMSYRMSGAIWKNVDDFLVRSGILPMLQEVFAGQDFVPLTNVVASCDSLPVLYKGKFYRMFVGFPNVASARLIDLYPQSIITLPYNGRMNYLVDPSKQWIDFVTWLDTKPPREQITTWLEFNRDLQRTYQQYDIRPALSIFITPSSESALVLPGDKFTYEHYEHVSFTYNIELKKSAERRGWNYDVKLALEGLILFQEKPEYKLPEINQAITDKQIAHIVDVLNRPVYGPGLESSELIMSVLSVSGWQQSFDDAFDQKELYEAAQLAFLKQLHITPYIREPMLPITVENARLFQELRSAGKPPYTSIMDPVEKARGRQTKVRIFSPLIYRLHEEKMAQFVQESKINPAKNPQLRMHEIRAIANRQLEQAYKQPDEGLVETPNVQVEQVRINGIVMPALELARVFVNTPFEQTAVFANTRSNDFKLDTFTPNDLNLINEFLAGGIMIGCLGIELTSNALQIMNGRDTLLGLYEHVPTRLVLDRVFVVGKRFTQQLSDRAGELVSEGQAQKLTGLQQYLAALGIAKTQGSPTGGI